MTDDGSLPATNAPLSTPTELPAIQPIRAFGRDNKASHAPAWYEPSPTPPENTSEARELPGRFSALAGGWSCRTPMRPDILADRKVGRETMRRP